MVSHVSACVYMEPMRPGGQTKHLHHDADDEDDDDGGDDHSPPPPSRFEYYHRTSESPRRLRRHGI